MAVSQHQDLFGLDVAQDNLLRRATIGDMVRRQSARIGSHPALVAYEPDGSRVQLTYKELNKAANRIANGLATRGIGRGDIVAAMSADKWRQVVAYLAALKLGAAFTPINPAYRAPEVERHLDHADPAVLFASAAMADVTGAALSSSAADPLTVATDDSVTWADATWSQLTEGGDGAEPDAIIDESDLALVIYTSGTESTPKGVAITHRNMLISTTPAWAVTQYVEQSDVFLLLAPLYTTAGLGTITTLLAIGATVVLADTTEPSWVLDVIKAEGVTNTSQTPTFYRRLVAHPGFDEADLGTLRQCHVYGGLIPKRAVEKIRRAAPGVMWASYWGQSELSQLGSIGFFGSMDDVPEGDPRWIGVPVPHLEVRIVDDGGADTDIGELLCRSPSVMVGYYKDPEATAAVFRDGWLRTGDIVRKDEHGNLFFLDRIKDMIKTGGMNVSSAEVEGVLSDHPTVADVAVVGVDDTDWSEAVVAVIVPVAGAAVDVDELIDFCRSRIAGYKVPKAVFLVDELPRDAQGKLRKRVIRDSLQ